MKVAARDVDVEDRLNEAERVMAVVTMLSGAVGRGGDLCLSSEIQEDAWCHLSEIAEDAFAQLRAVRKTLPVDALMLSCSLKDAK